MIRMHQRRIRQPSAAPVRMVASHKRMVGTQNSATDEVIAKRYVPRLSRPCRAAIFSRYNGRQCRPSTWASASARRDTVMATVSVCLEQRIQLGLLLFDLPAHFIQFFTDRERVPHRGGMLENGEVLRFFGPQIAQLRVTLIYVLFRDILRFDSFVCRPAARACGWWRGLPQSAPPVRGWQPKRSPAPDRR